MLRPSNPRPRLQSVCYAWLLMLQVAAAAAATMSGGGGDVEAKKFNVSYSIAEETNGTRLIGDLTADLQLLRFYTPAQLATKEVEFLRLGGRDSHLESFRVRRVDGQPVRHELLLIRGLDREAVCPEPGQADCHLTLSCVLRPYEEQFLLFTVRVYLQDVNDHSPVFEPPRHVVQFSEGDQPGTRRSVPHARDSDSGRNARLAYAIESHLGADCPFRVDSDSPTQVFVTLVRELDRENVSFYQVNITATDFGEQPRSGRLHLRVVVTDANDCFPVFERSTYRVNVTENSPPVRELLRVRADDADAGENGRVRYQLAPDTLADVRQYVSVGPKDGRIALERQVDREKVSEFRFQVQAIDGGLPAAKTSVATVHINVLDVNDCPPVISLSARRPSVLENRQRGTVVASFIVKDDDDGINGTVRCRLEAGSDAEFEVSEYDSRLKVFQLVTRMQLDRETRAAYPVVVACIDGGGLETREEFVVQVEDDNDHVPRFAQEHLYLVLPEDTPTGQTVANLSASDADSGDNARVGYFILSDPIVPETARHFQIGRASGELSLAQRLDREQRASFTVQVVAHDHNPTYPFSATATVFVEVRDVNDVAPVLPESVEFSVEENGPAGIRLGPVHYSDPDLNEGGRVTFYGGDQRDFHVTEDGHVVARRSFDREIQARHIFLIFARDHGTPSLTSSAAVTVHIVDRNDCQPQFIFPFAGGNYSVSAHEPANSLVLQAVAKDRDEGDNAIVRYSLTVSPPEKVQQVGGTDRTEAASEAAVGPAFRVSAKSGRLLVARRLSMPGDLGCHRLELRAADCGVPSLEAGVQFFLTVEDVPPKELAVSGFDGVGPGGGVTQTPLSTAVVTALIALTGLLLVLLVCVLLFLLQRRRAFAAHGAGAVASDRDYNFSRRHLRTPKHFGVDGSVGRGGVGGGAGGFGGGGGGGGGNFAVASRLLRHSDEEATALTAAATAAAAASAAGSSSTSSTGAMAAAVSAANASDSFKAMDNVYCSNPYFCT
ncbi:hypothetical protein BOX15_Mlig018610g2 [Macrostomum lignano]|uniref:Cadherin domain-containing protein n=1 Tax=Macrostomum lignano TaxID=282301 RepID=A0A267FNV8_9PLAT|nr:hypothetical protein BOX15_Mlig018610g2 [Macrostomum lignano]